jgi:hypothetical protein
MPKNSIYHELFEKLKKPSTHEVSQTIDSKSQRREQDKERQEIESL